MTNLSFSEALVKAKQGHIISRAGWNGKGMFLAYKPDQPVAISDIWSDAMRNALLNKSVPQTHVTVNAHLVLFTAQGTLTMGWVPSSSDMFAEDWIAE